MKMNDIIEKLNLLLNDTEKSISDLEEKISLFTVNKIDDIKTDTDYKAVSNIHSEMSNRLFLMCELVATINNKIINLISRVDC